MGALSKALLLFAMNWLDAQLTILWLRLDVATEGNGIMAALLNHSETSFLSVKLLIGLLSGYVLYRFSEMPIARRGMKVVLGIYMAIMGVHWLQAFQPGLACPRYGTFILCQPAASLHSFHLLKSAQLPKPPKNETLTRRKRSKTNWKLLPINGRFLGADGVGWRTLKPCVRNRPKLHRPDFRLHVNSLKP